MHLHRRLRGVMIAPFAVVAVPAPASARSSDPACRASAARATVPPLAGSEPAVANVGAQGCVSRDGSTRTTDAADRILGVGGADRVDGGRGDDRLDGRDRLRANRNERKRLRGCENRAYIR
jgi:hypothetical protein